MTKINWLFYLSVTTFLLSTNAYSEKIIFNSDSHIGYISIDISGTGCTGKIYWQTEDESGNKQGQQKSVDLVNCSVEPAKTEGIQLGAQEASTANPPQLVDLQATDSKSIAELAADDS